MNVKDEERVRLDGEAWAVVPKERLSDSAMHAMRMGFRDSFPDKRFLVLGGPVDLVSLNSLDAAWREAEAVIGSHRLEVGHTPRGLDEQTGKYRAWAVGLDTAWGPTPTAALQALTALLRDKAVSR